MKKTILFTLLLLIFLLAACNGGGTAPTESPVEPTAEPETEEIEATAESMSMDMVMLIGTTWVWTAFSDPTRQVTVDSPLNYTLDFQEDGTIKIKADCNNASGSYTTDGSSLTIQVGPMTLAACPPGSSSDDFINYLGAAAIYFLEEGNLYVDLMADGGTMTFSPVESMMADDGEGAIAGALMDNPWQWVAFTNPVEQFEVESPENYILDFIDDGTVAIQADCNNAMGSYSVDGSSLTIQVGPMTMAACPPESRSEDFVKYLGFAAIYFFEEGDLFIDLMADGGTMRFSPYEESSATSATSSADINLDAEPLFATLALGGGETLWLDPTLVSMRSGTVEGPGFDASALGENCTGIIPSQPDVVFNWEEHAGLDTLKIFTLSLGDPTLVLVTPSGEVLCSDDFNPLVLDPFIEITSPQVGHYAAFLGSFERDAVEPGFLVITSHDLNPANMDLSQMFPRHIDPRAISETLSLDVLEVESAEAVEPASGNMTPTDLAYQQELNAGGEIGMFNIELENQLCTGFVSAAPTFRFDWSGAVEQMVLYFESDMDTTLNVLAPDGTFHCDDDYHGSENLNPWVSLTPIEGTYNVWVGSFSPDVLASGNLTITNDANATPTPLTSQDLEN